MLQIMLCGTTLESEPTPCQQRFWPGARSRVSCAASVLESAEEETDVADHQAGYGDH